LDSLQTFLDYKAIIELKARYFRSVDTFDLDGWLGVFTKDAVLEFDLTISGPGQPEPERHRIEGMQAITAFWTGNSDRLQSVHHGHMPEIEILSDSEARGVWAMEDIVEFTGSTLHGFGHYHETYRKQGGQWRIARLHLTRTRLEVTARNRMSL
jgi:hypothetical protein